MYFPDRGVLAPYATCMSMPLVMSDIADIWVTDTNANHDLDLTYPNNDPNLTLGLGLATMLVIFMCPQRLSQEWSCDHNAITLLVELQHENLATYS